MNLPTAYRPRTTEHRAPTADFVRLEVQETSRSSFNVELDAANATWLSNDVAMLSTKSGELLLLTLVHDGRIVQKLDLSKSKASVLISGITTVGSSFFFLGSRLGDSLLVQFNCGAGSPMGAKEEYVSWFYASSIYLVLDFFFVLKPSVSSLSQCMLFILADPSTCTMSINNLAAFQTSKKLITACTLYHDRGTEPWLRKTSTDAWLLSGVGEAIEGPDGTPDQGDVYCVICYESGTLEIYDVLNFCCVFSVDSFVSGRAFIGDNFFQESYDSQKLSQSNNNDGSQNMKVIELAMHRWHGENSRPFLFGILTDGTILCYHAYMYEGSENTSKSQPVNGQSSSNPSASRLKNLRFSRVSLDTYTREEMSTENRVSRITMFKNIGGFPGFFLSGSRPAWFMKFRERIRIHPQLCDGPIIAFTVLHNMYCNHGFIYVTSQGTLKICQLPSLLSYDNYWPVQKIPLKATPHQVTYFPEKNLYPLIVSVPVSKPINQVLSSLVDQESGHQIEHDNPNLDGTYTVEEFEVRILEPESSSGSWQTKGTIHMQTSENALTVRVVTLSNTTTRENETLLAIGTAYVQGEDVAARGRVLLFSVESSTENSQAKVTGLSCLISGFICSGAGKWA
ncbi:hypothetical protein R6Q57_021334 [Mikania cordata]